MRNSLITMGMILALVLGLTPCAIHAQDVLTEVQIPRPGIQGMVSNVAPGDLTPEQLFYSLNIDPGARPGELRPRLPLRDYGTNNREIYGAYGYFNPKTGHKLIVGVGDSVYWQYFDSSGVTKNIPCYVGQFFVSDTFTTNVTHGVGSYVFPTADAYHDWTAHKDMLIHCDGKSLPIIITTSDASMRVASAADTTTFNPRVISMGLEAPGQLRVGMTDLAGSRLGAYRYSYAWVDTVTDTTSPMAIPSGIVYPDNHYPYLTQFETPVCDSAFATILILRQKQDGQAQWYVIDSLSLETTELTIKSVLLGYLGNQFTSQKNVKPNYTYEIRLGPADTTDGTNNKTFSFDTTVSTMYLSQLATRFADTLNSGAGDFLNWVMADSLIFAAIGDQLSITTQDVCSTFYYGLKGGMFHVGTSYDEAIVPSDLPFIYIDTISDTMASGSHSYTREFVNPDSSTFPQPGTFWNTARSDSVAIDSSHALDDSIYWLAYSYYDPVTGMESPLGPAAHAKLTDSTGDSMSFAVLQTGTPATGRPLWMRLYQGITTQALYGGGDTTVWYGLYEMRTGDSANAIIWGNWTDVQVNTGLDTSLITVDTIYEYQVFSNISGDPIIRPPYNYDNQIPFSDIDKFGGRFWGIGDPVCPSCVYFTAYDTVWNWYMANSFVLGSGVNDELVALEHLGNVLYAFKHNSIWVITSSDVEYNLLFEQMTNKTGAVSRETVVKVGDDIFFLAPDLAVYRLGPSGLSDPPISEPVRDWIHDSLFDASYATAYAYARLYKLGNAIKVQNDSTGEMFSFDYKMNTWGREAYPNAYYPRGSFQYDSTANIRGFGEIYDLLFVSDSVKAFQYQKLLNVPNEGFTPGWTATFGGFGDGVGLWTIVQIGGHLRGAYRSLLRTQLYYTIYDASYESLCSDSVKVFNVTANPGDETSDFWFDVIPHGPCKYPLVSLWTRDGIYSTTYADTNNYFFIDNAVVMKRYSGKNEAQ